MEHALTADRRTQRVAQRTDDIFQALVDEHGASVMALLRRLCRNPHDAEDVFQETAIRVWRGLAARPRLRSPKSWLMTIAYRAFLDHHKKRRIPVDGLSDSPDDKVHPPDARAEHDDQMDQVQAAIDKLPEAIREVVVLHYTGGLTIRMTAKAMQISEGTAKSRLHGGLKKLRSALT